jgi:hypothetical protein
VILDNPRYTGREVWNGQRRDEVLLDVEDVAAGHETKMRWNDRADREWSPELAHEAIIPVETFAKVQEQLSAGRNRPTNKKPRDDARAPYVLRGLLHCGICGRRMQGNTVRGVPRYRCRYCAEYAIRHELEHPKQLYVTEEPIVTAIDGWLSSIFDAKRIDETCEQLAAASAATDQAEEAQLDAARRTVTDCDERTPQVSARTRQRGGSGRRRDVALRGPGPQARGATRAQLGFPQHAHHRRRAGAGQGHEARTRRAQESGTGAES